MPSLVRNASVGGSTTNVTGLNCTTALTVALWHRMQSNDATDIIRHASTANNARDGFRLGFIATELRMDILGATGSTNYAAITGSPHRDGRWHHYVVTYDSTTDQMRGYVDGKLRTSIGNATRNITANASCTTTWNPNVIGSAGGHFFFDFQILPDVVVPPSDVPLLMDPRYQYQGVKGRYFGLGFTTSAAATGGCIDESGNGNNLTISPSAFQAGPEPPFRSTYQ